MSDSFYGVGVGVAVGVSVAVDVAVGVNVAVAVAVFVGEGFVVSVAAGCELCRVIRVETHKAKSSCDVPFANTVKMNLTFSPLKKLKSIFTE